MHARRPGPHPRILLNASRLAALSAQKNAGGAAWNALLDRCRKGRTEEIQSGYEAFDWANYGLDLALCGKIAQEPEYTSRAVRYFQAMLDDKEKLGDGAGGDNIVHHDDGYSIRTHGALGAILYDWLHDAPTMTPALRKHAADRFATWLGWYKQKGYKTDDPVSNYYAGYFGAVAFAGIAFEGDDPRAEGFRQDTQRMWNDQLVPTFRGKIDGGDSPEGWQYADLSSATLAIYADAESTTRPAPGSAPAKSLFDDLPWFRQSVTMRALALWPDGKHTYDGADHGEHPVVAPVKYLNALSVALPSSDPAGRQATFLARLARDPSDDFKWLAALADDPTRPAEDPRKGKASYFARGTETIFARSSFGPGAVWFTLTSAPRMSDHQHLDDGHFEIVRGGDALLIDAADYGSLSSLSHNVVLVDDPKQSSDWETSEKARDIITYKRNQAGWNDDVHIARYEDGGGYVYGIAVYDSAFNPFEYGEERHDRAVSRAEREAILSRTPVAGSAGESARLVLYDRMTFTAPRFTTAFVLHGGPAPIIHGPTARFSAGSSAALVTTLLPKGATSSVVDETHNTYSNDRPYFTNKPPDNMTSFRYEVAAPPAGSSLERRYLHGIVVGGNLTPFDRSTPTLIEADGVAGAVIDNEAYIFSSSAPATSPAALSYTAPLAAVRHVIADLAPSASYAVTVSSSGAACKVSLAPGAGKSASASGVLSLDVTGCTLH